MAKYSVVVSRFYDIQSNSRLPIVRFRFSSSPSIWFSRCHCSVNIHVNGKCIECKIFTKSLIAFRSAFYEFKQTKAESNKSPFQTQFSGRARFDFKIEKKKSINKMKKSFQFDYVRFYVRLLSIHFTHALQLCGKSISVCIGEWHFTAWNFLLTSTTNIVVVHSLTIEE